MQHFIPPDVRRLKLYALSHPPKGEPVSAERVLRRMRTLLAIEKHWTQYNYHRPKHRGFAHCLIGAWQYCLGGDSMENAYVLMTLHSLMPRNAGRGHKRLTQWNDMPERTHAEVLDLIDRAMEKVGGQKVLAV